MTGFDHDGPLTGGIQTTGDYPGKAKTPQELMLDMDKALVSSSGLDNVSPSFTLSWEKNVGLKSIPIFLSFANSTHLA